MLFFLKSSLCITLLWAFYQLVLSKEKSFQFNRFYLLGICIFSLSIPLVTFTITVFVEPSSSILSETNLPLIHQTDTLWFKLTQLLVVVYIGIGLLLFAKFAFNILSLLQQVRKNEVIKFNKYSIVLIAEDCIPHTFFNYIFINKKAFEANDIEKELLTHELLHISQKHTLDILFIEFLQLVFWLNPVWIFLKKSIRLNHEYLADSAVINTHDNISSYQYLLVNKTARIHNNYLASNLNFLLTKKRLIMMTTPVSHGRTLLKQLTIIPLLIGFIYVFSSKVHAQETIHKVVHKEQKVTKDTPPPPIKKVRVHKSEKKGEKIITVGNEIYHLKVNNGVKTYYDNKGKKVSKKFIKSKLPPLPPKPHRKPAMVKVHKNGGTIKIDGKTYTYKVKNNVRIYYDKFGNEVDGKKIEKRLPPPPPKPHK